MISLSVEGKREVVIQTWTCRSNHNHNRACRPSGLFILLCVSCPTFDRIASDPGLFSCVPLCPATLVMSRPKSVRIQCRGHLSQSSPQTQAASSISARCRRPMPKPQPKAEGARATSGIYRALSEFSRLHSGASQGTRFWQGA